MKKYLTWDFVLVLALLVGCSVASVAFIHYSYAWADEYTPALKYAMRIIGYIGTVYFPAKLVSFVMGIEHDEDMAELDDSWRTVCEEYMEDE